MKTKSREWSRDKLPESLKEDSRRMRKKPTIAEKIMWEILRDRRLSGFKFRRQQPLEGFIIDFYCDRAKLGIEVDGEIHLNPDQIQYDQERESYIKEFGIEIIRFTNQQVKNDREEVERKILKALKEREALSTANPSPHAVGLAGLPLSPGRGMSAGGRLGEGLKYFRFSSLLQNTGWMSPAYVGVNESGIVKYLDSQPPAESIATESVLGFALPGFQNGHSHAFQYAMAGLAENHAVGIDDDFWSWREAMYKCALTVDPDQAEAIAAILYGEMLRHGYTHVAEFHYLHHGKEGKPYNNLAEMGERMISAARTAGIKITLVPVFYQKGGFGLAPQTRQKRFISKSVDDYFKLLDASKVALKNYENAKLGFSVHSLRAVDLKDVVVTFNQGPKDLPFHIHVAEQKKEVDDCLAHCGKRPMQWMLENLPVDERFHLVHSTHLDESELNQLAKSKANVILCPSTEGNLGDGIFRMREYVKSGGRWSIGTDSHIGINPLEEFRMIDYHQRLVSNFRNTFEGDAAKYMVNEEIESGRKAMSHTESQSRKNHFEVGQPFDAIVYNAQSHLLADTSDSNRLATIVFTGDSSRNLGTIVNGKWVVKNQHHVAGRKLKDDFAKAMKELKNR